MVSAACSQGQINTMFGYRRRAHTYLQQTRQLVFNADWRDGTLFATQEFGLLRTLHPILIDVGRFISEVADAEAVVAEIGSVHWLERPAPEKVIEI